MTMPQPKQINQSEQLVKNWFVGDASNKESVALSHTVQNLVHVIKENRWSIVLLCLLGCFVGVFKAVSEKPVYQARLTMAVEPNSIKSAQQSMFDPFAYRFYETQYELLKSRSVAEKVVESLKLHERASINQLLVPPSFMQSLRYELAKLPGLNFLHSQQEPVVVTPIDVADQSIDIEVKKKWLTNIIQSGVSVSGGEKTNIVTVTFNSMNPNFAAEIANALVIAYIDLGLESQLNRSEQTSLWLSNRIVELKRTLEEAQGNLQNFLLQEDMLDSLRSNEITTSELKLLNEEYLTARARFDELAKRYGQRHPKITEARSEMSAAKSRWQSKSKSISNTKAKEFQLKRLERELQVNQELYDAFLAKFRESDLSSGSQVASARIVDKALPPGGPIHPNKQKIITTWAIGGFLLGILLAFLREQLDTTFKNIRSIEDKLGLPLLGVVQTLPKEIEEVERHYLDNTRSVFSEAINHIRTGVLYSNVDNPPKVMLITSSVQSEGKTTVASNLALSYAQLGPTLLIDADLRRPRIKHIVKTKHNHGLVDYVAGLVPLKECVEQDVQEKNLYILNSGVVPPNPLELLSSDKLKAIITGLRKQFSYIIIDTAPVLPASDAVVLGQLCDALLMVVQSDRTTHHMARDAIKRLNASKVEIGGLILSQAKINKGNAQYYGNYYGYGAYSYAEDNQQS